MCDAAHRSCRAELMPKMKPDDRRTTMLKIFAALMMSATLLGAATPSHAGSSSSVSVSQRGDVTTADVRQRSNDNAKVDQKGDANEARVDQCDPLALTLRRCR